MVTATNRACQETLNLTQQLETAVYEQLRAVTVEHSTIVSNFLGAAQDPMRHHLHTLSNEDTT